IPTTASSLASTMVSQPAARIRGPPTPKNSAPASRRRRASMSSAPYISPEASPAEMRIFTKSIVSAEITGTDGCSIDRQFHLVVGVRSYLRRVRPRSWYFLILVLQLVELVIDPALGEKLLVRAHFSHLSLVHHNDLVRSLHC